MRPVPQEILRYSIGAAAAFAVDVALLTVQVEYLHLHYLPAATISFIAGTVVIYWFSIAFVFRYRRLSDARAELGIFTAIGALGVLLNLACMFVAVELLSIHYVLAKVGSAALTFCTNFALRRLTLFTTFVQSHNASRQQTGDQ